MPLFIEELTRSVVDSGVAANDASGDTTANIVVPATLQDALEARFDRSPEVREVAQVGATIGREFQYDLLARVASLTTAELDAALDDLAGSGLIFARGTPPEANYTFKHALVQDTAYDSMLRGKRQDTHNRIANNLIDLRPARAEGKRAGRRRGPKDLFRKGRADAMAMDGDQADGPRIVEAAEALDYFDRPQAQVRAPAARQHFGQHQIARFGIARMRRAQEEVLLDLLFTVL